MRRAIGSPGLTDVAAPTARAGRLRARAVIFDFNGTLADDERLLARIFCDLLAEHGVAITPARYLRELAGLSDAEIASRGLALRGRPGAVEDVNAIVAERYRRYRSAAAVRSPLRAGAADLVRALAARVPVGVVSGAERSEVVGVLTGAGLRSLLTVCVCAEDVRAGKPDPEGYLRALDALRPLDPRDVVAIEDSPAGIRAALAAGMRCLAIAGTAPRRALAQLAEGVLESLQPSVVMGTLDV